MIHRFGPALVVAAFLLGHVAIMLALNHGEVGEMGRLGIRRLSGDPTGFEGYDGQYTYLLAVDPDPAKAVPGPFDVPAYRYQRILYSLVVRALALGQPDVIPWMLIAVNIAAQTVGTFLVGELLATYGASRWYALAYGLWVGYVYSVRLAMTEPLAYAWVAAAWLASRRGREGPAALLYALALFTKEVTVLFSFPHLVWLMLERRWREAGRLALVAFVPFVVFQLFILGWFGRLGLGSGGWHASGFEWVPYNGLWRIGQSGWLALALFATLYLPMAVLPSLWALITAAARVIRREWTLPVLVLGANAAIFPVTPFSTYSEPLGFVRLVCGLVLAVLVFGAYAQSRRVLNYALFWIAALAMLLNEAR